MKSVKPIAITATMLLLVIPLTFAEEETSCSLSNLGNCIRTKLFEGILAVLNAPTIPLLSAVKTLLTTSAVIESFKPIWQIIVYILSIFYGLLLLYSGIKFIISGYSPEQREFAKEWMMNIIIMIVFVQSSYFLYSILNDLASNISIGVIGMINPDFFLATATDSGSMGVTLILQIPYIAMLLISVIMLAVRYLLVSAGIFLFPIALFLYFIPFLRGYGKFLMNIIFLCMFLPFFQSIILLAGSLISELPVFSTFKTLILAAIFLIINVIFYWAMYYIVTSSAHGISNSTAGKATVHLHQTVTNVKKYIQKHKSSDDESDVVNMNL